MVSAGVLAARLRDLRHALARERQRLRARRIAHRDPPPLAAEDAPPLHLFLPLRAEALARVERALLRLRAVEGLAPRGHGGEDERVLERELDAQRSAGHLRHRAVAPEQGRHARDDLLVGARRAARPREDGEIGHRPPALLHQELQRRVFVVGDAIG
jgi:hypothetical protein